MIIVAPDKSTYALSAATPFWLPASHPSHKLAAPPAVSIS
jgi:hypothetical protein